MAPFSLVDSRTSTNQINATVTLWTHQGNAENHHNITDREEILPQNDAILTMVTSFRQKLERGVTLRTSKYMYLVFTKCRVNRREGGVKGGFKSHIPRNTN